MFNPFSCFRFMPVIVLSIPRMDLLIIAKPLNERMQDRKCQRENRVALPSSLPPCSMCPPCCVCSDGASQCRFSSPELIKATSYTVSGTEKQEELCLGPLNTKYKAGRQTKVNFASRVC